MLTRERGNGLPHGARREAEDLRAVLGQFASGVVAVTGRHEGRPIGMTAQSFCSLSLDPPMILFCPAKTSQTWPRIASTGQFSVSVLSDQQEHISRQLAGKAADKFAGVEFAWSDLGNPLIKDCLAHLECELSNVHEGGDHAIVTGLVRRVTLEHPGLPLLFFRSCYCQLTATA